MRVLLLLLLADRARASMCAYKEGRNRILITLTSTCNLSWTQFDRWKRLLRGLDRSTELLFPQLNFHGRWWCSSVIMLFLALFYWASCFSLLEACDWGFSRNKLLFGCFQFFLNSTLKQYFGVGHRWSASSTWRWNFHIIHTHVNVTLTIIWSWVQRNVILLTE